MIGQKVSHYRVLERLGGGGMGEVFKAEDLRLERQVALKFLPPELGEDPVAKERFMQEAKAASALDHPNICTIHDIDETEEGRLFLAMASYDGETLAERLAAGPLTVEEALEIAEQVTEGLVVAHGRGIVHRDIKPANLMITRRGVVKILDFGLAKLAEGPGLTKTGTSVGTPAYMSPEQARGEEHDVSQGSRWSDTSTVRYRPRLLRLHEVMVRDRVPPDEPFERSLVDGEAASRRRTAAGGRQAP